MAEALKDSGIEWISEIPTNWKLLKLKNVIKYPLQYGANDSGCSFEENLPRYIRITDITNDNRLKDSDKLSLSQEKSEKYILSDGDILLARSGGTVGKTFIYKKEYGICAFAGYLIKATIVDDVLPMFIYYYTLSSAYIEWKNRIFIQATIQNIGASKYANMEIAIPTEHMVQSKIVDFLNQKYMEINNLITQTVLSIEEYKKYKQSLITEAVTKGLNPDVEMKDSGIEWIGETPKDWKNNNLKRISNIRYGLGQPPAESGNGIPIIRATNISAGMITTENMIYTELKNIPVSKDVVLVEGDILIVRSGAYAGDVGYIDANWAGAIAGYDIIISTRNVNSRFILYSLLSTYVLVNQLLPMRMRSAQPHLNAEEVGSIVILLPNIYEQNEIVEYLDAMCRRIDLLVGQKKLLLSELESYKKSLIYECVTGKREVN